MDNFLFLKMKKNVFLKCKKKIDLSFYTLYIILDENIIYFLFILRLFTVYHNMQF